MSITATCAACGRNFIAPPQFQGKRVKCKGCGEIFQIPRAGGSQAPVKEAYTDIDPLSQIAAIATSDSSYPGAAPTDVRRRILEADTSEEIDEDQREPKYTRPGSSGLTPNVLTFNYPGASDVDQWLPITLVVLGFLLLLTSINPHDAQGIGWIAFTRLLTPAVFFLAFIFPVTLGMIRKAAREQRFAMPPNFKLRCLASYMPAFVILTWMQMGGEGLTILQLFAGIFGLAISSGVLWLLFRLREEHVGTTVIYGAGGFAAAAALTIGLTLGVNKVGGLLVTSAHAENSVPVSPFGEGLAWVSAPPAPVVAHVDHPQAPPANSQSAGTAPGIQAGVLGEIDSQTIPVDVDDLIDPLGNNVNVAVIHKDQNAVEITSWNAQTWKPLPGVLKFPTRPAGKMVLSIDGDELAWIAEFPRLSIQIWSFSKSAVVSSVELDRAAGRADLVGFVGPDLVLIDRTLPKTAPPAVAAAQAQTGAVPQTNDTPQAPEEPPAGKPANIFDDMAYNPKRLAEEANQKPGQAPTNETPTGQTPGQPVPPTGFIVHQFSVVHVGDGSNVCTFTLPPLMGNSSADDQGDSMRVGQNVAVSVDTSRLVAVVKKKGIPTLLQIDLTTGKSLGEIPVAEIDPSLSASPTGLAYSNDGINLAALFENGGSALLLSYNANTSKKISNFVYPAGPLEGATHGPFQGSSICWMDPIPCWLVYGQGVISTQTGSHLRSADLNLASPFGQRFTEDDRMELVTPIATGKRLTILKVDRTKLEAALDAAAAPPAPADQP
jgi:hypothetical protein